MTITTLAGAISKLQYPRDYVKSNAGISGLLSLWGGGAGSGFPANGGFDTTLNGVNLVSPVTGQIAFPDPANTGYLSKLELQSNNNCYAVLADRIWHNGGMAITSNASQSIVSPTWPARDARGATAGDGLMIGLEISSGVGAATPTVSVGYTNSSGTSGRTATNILTTGSGAGGGSFFEFSLQAGDTGVQSIQSLTLSTSWISGTMNLVVYRPLAFISLMPAVTNSIDVVTGGFPVLYTGSVPFIIYKSNSAANLYGKILFSDG